MDDIQFAAEFHADVAVEKIAEVYADAFLNAVCAKGVELSAAMEEFTSFVELLQKLPKLAEVLASAMVQTPEKVALMQKALTSPERERRGSDEGERREEMIVTPLFWDFLQIVAKRGRLDIIYAIYRAALVSYDRRRNIIPVVVTAAAPLDGEQVNSLAAHLRTVTGGEPQIKTVVDPELIGGLVVRVADTIYDASIVTQLKNVRQQMIDRSAHEIQCRRDNFRHTEGN